jgi:hypothetical protein
MDRTDEIRTAAAVAGATDMLTDLAEYLDDRVLYDHFCALAKLMVEHSGSTPQRAARALLERLEAGGEAALCDRLRRIAQERVAKRG